MEIFLKSPPWSPYLPSWSMDVMAGAPEAVLNHEVILRLIEQLYRPHMDCLPPDIVAGKDISVLVKPLLSVDFLFQIARQRNTPLPHTEELLSLFLVSCSFTCLLFNTLLLWEEILLSN